MAGGQKFCCPGGAWVVSPSWLVWGPWVCPWSTHDVKTVIFHLWRIGGSVKTCHDTDGQRSKICFWEDYQKLIFDHINYKISSPAFQACVLQDLCWQTLVNNQKTSKNPNVLSILILLFLASCGRLSPADCANDCSLAVSQGKVIKASCQCAAPIKAAFITWASSKTIKHGTHDSYLWKERMCFIWNWSLGYPQKRKFFFLTRPNDLYSFGIARVSIQC